MKNLSHSHIHTHSLRCTPKWPFKETHRCLPYFGELWTPTRAVSVDLPCLPAPRWSVESHMLLPVSFNCVFEVTVTVKQWHRRVKMKATACSLRPSQVLDGPCCGVLNSLWVEIDDPSYRGPGVLLSPTSLPSSAVAPQGTKPSDILAHLPAKQ